MSRMPLMLAFVSLLSLSLSSAGSCEDACQAEYDRWVGVADGNLASKAYYCGVSSTNCDSRENVPSGQSDPCWAMCYQDPFDDNGFQACCHASAVENSQGTLDQCLASCAPGPGTQPGTGETRYSVQISSSGDVTIRDLEGNPVSGISDSPVSIRTGSDGYLYLDFMASGGTRTMRVQVYPDTRFNFDGSSCAIGSGGDSAGISGTSASLSSEHGSCRGTINGGGDFIKGKDGSVAYLSDEKTVRLSTGGDTGRIDIEEDTSSGEPGFELLVALPDGTITIDSPYGQSSYSVEISGGKARIGVVSGDIALSSSAGGYGRSLTSGDSVLLGAADISAPLIDGGADGASGEDLGIGDIAPSPEPEGCCGSAFILSILALAASFMVSRFER